MCITRERPCGIICSLGFFGRIHEASRSEQTRAGSGCTPASLPAAEITGKRKSNEKGEILCKEGYRGLRCDQFVPKTDSILSDPKSGETYQRQIMSIFSIAVGISLLGVACMAFYCRNNQFCFNDFRGGLILCMTRTWKDIDMKRRQREKHRAQLTDLRSLRDCGVNASRLMSNSSPRTESGLRHQKCCRVQGASPTPGCSTVPSNSKVPAPDPISNLSTGKRRRCQPQTDGNQYSHSYLNMQTVASAHSSGRLTYTDVPCTRLDQGTAFPPPSRRTCSVPIIPSVQAPDLGDRSVDQGSTALLYKGGASASHTLIRRETVMESLVSSSQSLASPGVAQGSIAFTCSESALGGEAKHKSLVTYTTALRPGTESSRAKTVISTTVLGSGEQSAQQSSSLSRSMGRLERRHSRPAHGGIPREEHGAPLQTPYIRGEKGHLSAELRDPLAGCDRDEVPPLEELPREGE
ncbi:hypothetical protein P4O66_001463 [Electrophorus voltai]|uniref:EGF-like domain-containing protein n=1 Tax=Electrophorus voltai TaxID=2609070 RepID=A0AAD9DTU2_9TELE|nr:hypothetical protein P4O66_001463 [Electrophorus voltai]